MKLTLSDSRWSIPVFSALAGRFFSLKGLRVEKLSLNRWERFIFRGQWYVKQKRENKQRLLGGVPSLTSGLVICLGFPGLKGYPSRPVSPCRTAREFQQQSGQLASRSAWQRKADGLCAEFFNFVSRHRGLFHVAASCFNELIIPPSLRCRGFIFVFAFHIFVTCWDVLY